jgi:hypothetical protein
MADYADQKTCLEKLFETEGKDVFVAKYSAIEKQDTSEIVSWASWTDGVPTYLPKVDMVALGRGETSEDYKTLGFVPWDEFQEKLGPCIQKTEYYPGRYFVESFPEESILDQVKFMAL